MHQLTFVILYRSTVTKEAKAPMVFTKPEYVIYLAKGYYHGVYVFLEFNKEDDIYTKDKDTEMGDDLDKGNMEDGKLEDEKERPWRMVLEGNEGGIDDEKSLLHAKRWDL